MASKRGSPAKSRRYPGARSRGALQAALDETARRMIRGALEETEGNVQGAARKLGVNPASLRKRMAVLGISADEFRPGD